MARRLTLLLAVLLLPALGGCGFIVVRTARHVYNEYTKEERAVDSALARLRDAVLAQDAERIAALFEPAAELALDGAPPVTGRDAVRAAWQAQAAKKLLTFELEAGSTTVNGDQAQQRGIYRRKQAGDAEAAQGTFEADWARPPGGSWLLHRLRLAPGKGKA